MFFDSNKMKMPTAAEALPGRREAMPVPAVHYLLGTPLVPPFPEGAQKIGRASCRERVCYVV